MQDRLAAAATKAPVMKFVVEDAGHNDFYAVGKDQILRPSSSYVSLMRPVAQFDRVGRAPHR